jgi:uncharacterized membrane protein YgaE (UPF0421/DUF939 family)
MSLARLHPVPAFGRARRRVRTSMRPILQTAAAAVIAWYAALLVLPDPRPAFASIAAVIAIGTSFGERRERALQLTAGVVVGITVADLLVQLIGIGAPQIGVMVLLAMTAARALGGGELLVSEAAVSAILLVTLDPNAGAGFSPNRMLEAAIGGGVALGLSAVLLPPDPALEVARAAQSVFAELGRALERIATGLDKRDPAAAEQGLAAARAIDPLVRELEDALDRSRETSRLTASPRRASRAHLGRYERSFEQVDLAVRDARVLARHAVRALRTNLPMSPELPSAVRELELTVWELAAAYDDPARMPSARSHAVAAGALAAQPAVASPATAQLLGQVRSMAVDLRRAVDAADGGDAPVYDRPTEELLIVPSR